MKYAGCCVPVSAIRNEPLHRSEMISQLLFGECCTILEYGIDSWVRIKCRYDNYEGWCLQSHLVEIGHETFLQADKELTDGWVNEVDYNGHNMHVPMGSSLTALKHGKAFWRKNSIQYSGKVWKPLVIKINPKIVKQIAFKFLNTSYLWGGRSVFGTDCSGYTQMVYKFLNVPLPRDARYQAEKGKPVTTLKEAVCGDLAFFDNEEGKVTHVGIILNPKEIIHSSGKVRIDTIDDEGIVNSETKMRTHKLKIIKRYF